MDHRVVGATLAFAAGCFSFPDIAWTQTVYSWVGGDGNWNDSQMWSPNGVPTGVDTVRVTATGSYRVSVDAPAHFDVLEVGDGSTSNISLDLGSSSVVAGSPINIKKGGTLSSGTGAQVTTPLLVIEGASELGATTVNGNVNIVADGALTVLGKTTVDGRTTNHGTVTVAASWTGPYQDAEFTILSGLRNHGSLLLFGSHSGTATGLATLVISDSLVNTGRIRSRGTDHGPGNHTIKGILDNRGEILAEQRPLTIEGGGAHVSTGTLSVADNMRVLFKQSGDESSVTLAGSVLVGSAGTFEISGGRVNVEHPSLLAAGGPVIFKDGAKIYLGRDFRIDGQVQMVDVAIHGPGSLTLENVLTLDNVVYNTNLTVLPGARLDWNRTVDFRGALVNRGELWIVSSWWLARDARATLGSTMINDGVIVLWGDQSGSASSDSWLTVPDSLVNNGRIVVRGTPAGLAHRIITRLVNIGELELIERSVVLVSGTGDHVNRGVVRTRAAERVILTGGAGLRHESGSLISGDGTLDVRAAPEGMTTTEGSVGPGRPGGATGILTIEGSLSLTPDAFFDVDLAGTVPGTGYDQLQVTSALRLDGTLRISVPDTFITAVGDTFSVAAAPSLEGVFALIEQPPLSGKHFSVVYEGGVVRVITLSGGVAIEEEGDDQLPKQFVLDGAYPNPFNPSTTIRFDLPESAEVLLTVYDVLGRQVRRLGPSRLEAGGGRSVVFDAIGLPSGLYLYQLVATTRREVWAATGSLTFVK